MLLIERPKNLTEIGQFKLEKQPSGDNSTAGGDNCSELRFKAKPNTHESTDAFFFAVVVLFIHFNCFLFALPLSLPCSRWHADQHFTNTLSFYCSICTLLFLLSVIIISKNCFKLLGFYVLNEQKIYRYVS